MPDIRLVDEEITLEALDRLSGKAWDTITLVGAKYHSPIMAKFKYAKSIESISLFGPEVSSLARLERVNGLKSLEIGAPLTIGDLESLSEFSELERLSLPQKMGLTVTGAKQVAKLTNLKSLRLYNVDVDDASFSELNTLVNLEELDLSHTHATDEGLRVVENLPKLRVLSLTRYDVPQQLTDKCLSSILKASSLKNLSIWNTRIDGDGFAALPDSRIETLHLSSQQLRVESAIRNLKQCPRLKMLIINGEPNDNGVEWQKQLPNIDWLFHS